MGTIQKIEDYNLFAILTDEESQKLRLICRILAIVCNIPCFLSIFVFLFQDSKLHLGQQIELILCISIFFYESSHYLPASADRQWLCYFQCILSFGIQIVISYLVMIYSYIALKKFTNPDSVKSKCNIFFIYFSPIILFIIIIIYILFRADLSIFFEFTVYPTSTDNLSRLLNYFLLFLFLVLNIINTSILIKKIKNFKKTLVKIDIFIEEKLRVFIKKLIFSIIGLIFVFHNSLPVGILTSLNIVGGDVFFSFGYFLYLYINKAMLGIVFWFIYIFNINLWHKFLILIRIEKKEEFKDNFEKEEKAMEYSIEEGSRLNTTITYNMEELEKIPSLLNNNDSNYIYEDESL